LRIRPERYRQTELAGALLEHVLVRQADELTGQLVAGEREAQFRADAGRLARGQRDAGKLRT
jgi:hypothetical protein